MDYHTGPFLPDSTDVMLAFQRDGLVAAGRLELPTRGL
jgi:hypothetical protein